MSFASDRTSLADLRWIPVTPVALCACLAFALHMSVPLNHDVAWIMEGAARLLNGGEFGRDVIDANPPLAWWLSVIPAASAHWTGLGLATSSVLFTLACGLCSVTLTGIVLMREAGNGLLISLLSVLLLIAPGYDFGQREHLMLMAAVPYIAAASMSAARRALPTGLRLAIGLVAACGFCLKPYFLFIPLSVEIWLAYRSRSLSMWLRPEFLTIPAFGMIYVACIWVFAPDYLTTVMPQAAAIYWSFNSPLGEVLKSTLIMIAPGLIGWCIVLTAIREKPSDFAQAVGIGLIGAVASVVVQMKGFSYHLVPAAGLSALACISDGVSRHKPREPLRAAIVTLVMLSCVTHAFQQAYDAASGHGTAARVAALASAFQHYAGQGGQVYAFISSPRDIHPAVIASGTMWASQACCAYHLPAAIRVAERPASDRARIQEVARRQLDKIIADLVRKRPPVIVIDAWPGKLGMEGKAFNYLPYLSRNLRFAALWRLYSERQPIGGFRVFVLKSYP